MKKATSKILMAAMSLVVAIGIATGTTFAWFTTNRTVSVATVQAKVTTGTDGLYVAVKTGDDTWTDFKSGLDAEDMKLAIYGKKNATTEEMNAGVEMDALTIKSVSDYALKDEKGGDAAAYVRSVTAKNKYIEFTLKFRTTVAQNVYLAVNDGATSPNASEIKTVGATGVTANQVLAWTDDSSTYGKAITKGNAIDARAAHAARVSFVSGSNKNIWAPYDLTDESQAAEGFYKGNLAADYNAYFLNPNATGNADRTGVLNTVTLMSDEDAKGGFANKDKGTILATTAANDGAYEAEMTVRIWIEGTDGDCFNSIFGDQFTVNLVFNSVRASA